MGEDKISFCSGFKEYERVVGERDGVVSVELVRDEDDEREDEFS